MTTLANKNVLITGSASGIGRLMAEEAAARGAHLILWDIDTAGLESLTAELHAAGHKASSYRCDLSDREDIQRVAAQVLQDHKVVDVMINNAGIVSGKPYLEITDEAIERTMKINTMALFWTTRAFLPAMLAQNSGHLVTIASAAGIVGAPRLSDYTASKHAAVGLDDVLRMELSEAGSAVQTTLVCPYYINTGMFKGVRTRFPWLLPILEPEKVAARAIKAIEKNQARVLLPVSVYLLYPLRILPVRLSDRILNILGVHATMNEFEGRTGR